MTENDELVSRMALLHANGTPWAEVLGVYAIELLSGAVSVPREGSWLVKDGSVTELEARTLNG